MCMTISLFVLFAYNQGPHLDYIPVGSRLKYTLSFIAKVP